MAPAGLKPSLELVDVPGGGGRLTDAETGATLVVSDLERKLLERWGGAGTATELAARVFADGVDLEAPQVEVVFVRLQRAGLLATNVVPTVPGLVGSSGDLPDDEAVVPRLRSDLVVRRPPNTRATVQVTDPATGQTFTLFDSELSVARLLDGRRTAREAIDAATEVGVPASLETLRDFVRQLTTWRFIDARARADLQTTWPPRRCWAPEVRELHRSALRLFRVQRYREALACVDSLLSADPSNEEALALRSRLSAEQNGQRELDVAFDVLHTGLDPFSLLAAVGDPTRRAQAGGPRLWDSAVNGDELPTQADMPPAAPPPAPSRRPWAIAAAVGLGAALLGGALLHPVPKVVVVPCTVAPKELERVEVPDGEVTFSVESGAAVKAGQVVAQVKRANLSERARLEQGLKEDRALRAKLAAFTPNAARVAAAQRQVAAAQAQLTAATAARRKVGPAKTPAAKAKVATLDGQVIEKIAALDKAKAGLEAATQAEALNRVTRSIEAGERALAALLNAPPQPLKVTRDGVLLRPTRGGAQVVANVLEVKAEGAKVPAGRVEVALGGVSRAASSDGVQVTTAFEHTALSAACRLSFTSGTTMWVLAR